ncbi:MAG: bifunctional diaminohydroxyphosphoribosylaminopyrimidine deaminase/5-amino-6-(5-phosphoribosylamino)uracil reductase RibD [Lachnospiraceae bacterium]|jgi:diaminohydroxyphosphoribosylaminopyrimidine deaminase/5-amino-6-(5-phosphoribosylamino)uracil reductase|nr:bifunctional diaminohydroxyphosphoribosylaminopyrimidine deaminase/5-amino-6-(5-phosphoribosylamino)uracil reductase RibD [Lachnospiraceae bacterium]MEE3460691.1 bifunctional diaminohydroxyphosphoribosylaminopyrimidine deaminase/5-amino-6-(5-phosphoribosylamino)uracil reductase RibD [Lachnospiraceae bacterium]
MGEKFTLEDESFMQRALSLAVKGSGAADPNPLVGAVIVRDGRVIAEGYHHKCGELHAERDALKNAAENDVDVRGAKMYVTLEPCCHFGKQPPCTEAIIKAGIKEVYTGSFDPNPLVSGKGAKQLRDAGLTVHEGLLREECDAINEMFFHYITTGLPYVDFKTAVTLDGKTACATGESKWISGPLSRYQVHRMRNHYPVIMTGIGTVLKDDPMLNTRLDEVPDELAGMDISDLAPERNNPFVGSCGRSPVRVICDSYLRIPVDSRIVNSADKYKTIIAVLPGADPVKIQELKAHNVQVMTFPKSDLVEGMLSLRSIIKYLGEQKYSGVLLECGGTLASSAFTEAIVDHVSCFVAPKIFGGAEAPTAVEGLGVRTPDECVKLKLENSKKFGDDLLLNYVKA